MMDNNTNSSYKYYFAKYNNFLIMLYAMNFSLIVGCLYAYLFKDMTIIKLMNILGLGVPLLTLCCMISFLIKDIFLIKKDKAMCQALNTEYDDFLLGYKSDTRDQIREKYNIGIAKNGKCDLLIEELSMNKK
ncbi:hypothetical protein H4J57_09790 [Colwellia sp. BRX8-7]|jgi:hypothetical protein|uniref:hypothetical protein n=1 Tax=Colwellia sp. BRX8-7 TaxID=2759833 RepID=UPI0015F77470|nr:hypothetical protein [Colwellia sp. BRX8-7]MBA6337492.1 hypothetical protein [Colwellia sp. BRX8-7]